MSATARKQKPVPIPGTVGTDGIRWNPFNVQGDIEADLFANGKLNAANSLEQALPTLAWRLTWGNIEIPADEKFDAYTPPMSCASLAKRWSVPVWLVQRTIERLRKAGIIITDPASDKGGKPQRFRLAVENWHRVAKYETPKLPVFKMRGKPAAESDDEPLPDGPIENSADERQLAFEGFEPFEVQAAKPAIVGIHRRVDNVRLKIDDRCQVEPEFQGWDLCLNIKVRSVENAAVNADTSARTCGGQKLSDSRFLRLLMDGLAARQVEVERALGVRLVGELGRCREAAYLKYALETLDADIGRAKKGYKREWLPEWARKVAERWPQAQKRRAAKAAAAAEERPPLSLEAYAERRPDGGHAPQRELKAGYERYLAMYGRWLAGEVPDEAVIATIQGRAS